MQALSVDSKHFNTVQLVIQIGVCEGLLILSRFYNRYKINQNLFYTDLLFSVWFLAETIFFLCQETMIWITINLGLLKVTLLQSDICTIHTLFFTFYYIRLNSCYLSCVQFFCYQLRFKTNLPTVSPILWWGISVVKLSLLFLKVYQLTAEADSL